MNFLENVQTHVIMNLMQASQKMPVLLGSNGSWTKGKITSILAGAIGPVVLTGCGLTLLIAAILKGTGAVKKNDWKDVGIQVCVGVIGGVFLGFSFTAWKSLLSSVGSDLNIQ